MKRLLIATTNPGKLREIGGFLKSQEFSLLSLNNFPFAAEIEETGATFEENAVIKARGYFDQIKIPTLADDSGIEIDALHGEPGVKSRRWIGREMTDKEIIDHTLFRLQGVPFEKRTARLCIVMAFYDGVELITDTDCIEGVIAEKYPENFDSGYPFRPIFFIPKFGKLYTNLTLKEHEDINHRLRVLKRLKDKIEARLT